jgi:hypothetical protein
VFSVDRRPVAGTSVIVCSSSGGEAGSRGGGGGCRLSQCGAGEFLVGGEGAVGIKRNGQSTGFPGLLVCIAKRGLFALFLASRREGNFDVDVGWVDVMWTKCEGRCRASPQSTGRRRGRVAPPGGAIGHSHPVRGPGRTVSGHTLDPIELAFISTRDSPCPRSPGLSPASTRP